MQGHVRLTLLKDRGQAIATLLDENVEEGDRRITWDGTGYEDGIYFYRLESNGVSETKKFILQKH